MIDDANPEASIWEIYETTPYVVDQPCGALHFATIPTQNCYIWDLYDRSGNKVREGRTRPSDTIDQRFVLLLYSNLNFRP